MRLLFAMMLALAGCASEPPRQRDAVAACRVEADRALTTRNRTDSLRNDDRDARTGQQGFEPGTNRASDIIGRERLVDECLARGARR